jgi:hypothetical protein
MNKKFFKKIAYKTELAMVLIGQADFIEEEIVGFIKLTQAVVFENFGEIPLPTKFIFIAISPKHSDSHHELAKCMATLFSDEVIHWYFLFSRYLFNTSNSLLFYFEAFSK